MVHFIRNPATLPLWQNISIHTGPFANTTTRTTTDQGYDIDATRLSDARRAAAFARANAWICDGHYQYPLFLTDFALGTQLAGSRAQSIQTRDFYPRNFVQPNYSITGQSLDQESYGKMCDFIRHIQYEAIQNNLKPTTGARGVALGTGLVQLSIAGRGIEPSRTGGPSVRLRSKLLGNATRYNQMIKGQHQSLIILGYFNTMPREHQKGQYSPVWTAQFIVVDMVEGPFQEDMVTANKQKTWVDLLHSTQNISYTPQVAKQIAQADIDWINKNSLNIINTNPITVHGGGGSTGGGTPSVGGYVNPFGQVKNASPERLDQGVDFNASAGSPILAIGDFTVYTSMATGSGWGSGLDRSGATTAFVGYTLTSGQYKGKHVYVAEDFVPHVSSGHSGKAGDVIGVFKTTPAGIETGWASGSGAGALDPHVALNTEAAHSFERFIVALGAPKSPGADSAPTPDGFTMPPGYP